MLVFVPGLPPGSAAWQRERKPAETWVLIEKLWKERKTGKGVKLFFMGRNVNICECVYINVYLSTLLSTCVVLNFPH